VPIRKKKLTKQYNSLEVVMLKAYARASVGKGRERHADERNFENQELCNELRLIGPAGSVFQIRKKAGEVLRLSPEKAMPELLDIIVHAAACYIVLEEKIKEEKSE